MTYTVTVTNAGPARAYGVTSILVVPLSGFTVTGTTGGPIHPSPKSWWKTYSSLASGQTTSYTVTGTVGKLKNGTLLQAFAVANATNPPDPILITNLSVLSTRVGR